MKTIKSKRSRRERASESSQADRAESRTESRTESQAEQWQGDPIVPNTPWLKITRGLSALEFAETFDLSTTTQDTHAAEADPEADASEAAPAPAPKTSAKAKAKTSAKVKAKKATARAEATLAADAPAPAGTFAVGQEVLAIWKKEDEFHGATVIGVNADGTYKLTYDDSAWWDNCPAEKIRARA